MISRRAVVVAFSILAAASAGLRAWAAEPSAREFVAAIYDTYKGKDAKGVLLDSDESVRRYFEPSLAALILKDREEAAKKDEVPAIDGDLFVDAQDWEISDINIAVRDEEPAKATADVKFKNLGEAKSVTLDLVQDGGGWRIADIHWAEGTLRGVLTKK